MKSVTQQIAISTTEGRYFFNPEEIIRLEASSNYTNVYFTNKRRMLTARVLKDYEEILQPLGFVRTHRSHLVNSKYVSFVDHKGNIMMKDESRAEISRRKRPDVLKALLAS
jgi:two-component system, LytTR family, response regulator